MINWEAKHEQCTLCEVEYTSIHCEVASGIRLSVCDRCLRTAKDNFIWICMSCGQVYVRPKNLVISRMRDFELKQAYMLCEDMQIIQGIDMCVSCDPEGVLNYMEVQKTALLC